MEKWELSSEINLSPPGKSDLILKGNYKQRSEANDGKAYTLIYLGKGRASSEGVGCHHFSILFWSLMSGPSHGRCVIQYANVVKSMYNETQGLLEVRAIFIPACSIWVFWFVGSFLIPGTFNSRIYVNLCYRWEGMVGRFWARVFLLKLGAGELWARTLLLGVSWLPSG